MPDHTHSIYGSSEAPSSLMAPLDRLSSSALFLPALVSLLPLLFPSHPPPPPLFFQRRHKMAGNRQLLPTLENTNEPLLRAP